MKELVYKKNRQTVTSSRIVAENFKKQHKTVLRSIENLNCSDEFRRHNFVPSSYTNEQNREMPEYIMTKDGFMFLVMGFNGKKSGEVKEKFINLFNKMADKLVEIAKPKTTLELLESAVTEMKRLEEEKKELKQDIQEKQKTIELQAPRITKYNELLDSQGYITTTQIAAEFGMSAMKLNKTLRELGIQRSINKGWTLRTKHLGKGLEKMLTHKWVDAEGKDRSSVSMVWTQKGRIAIHYLLKRQGFKKAA